MNYYIHILGLSTIAGMIGLGFIITLELLLYQSVILYEYNVIVNITEFILMIISILYYCYIVNLYRTKGTPP
jgi:hypothetical protein